MLDCLPTPSEWSPRSQYAMLLDQLQSLRHHLEALETAAGTGVSALLAAGPQLLELNTCCLDAHALLTSLASLPAETLRALEAAQC